MRIISQDGKIDIPYEKVVIVRRNKNISYYNKALNPYGFNVPGDIEIASYSTEEKAKKAIELMRKEYSEYEVLKAIMPGCADRFIKGYSIDPNNGIFNDLESFNTFRFPKNEEI